MIDNFALAVTHGLLLLAAWRLLARPGLEDDRAAPTSEANGWRPAAPGQEPPRA